jgi:RNA polymerase sigma factor (sigma-70 family)
MSSLTTEVDGGHVADMVRRAAAGDSEAWGWLVDQYSRLIWFVIAEFRLVESDAADVAQTTWLRLLEHIDRLNHPDRVSAWLTVTARNECLRHLAARKRVVLASEDFEADGVAEQAPEIDDRLLAVERAEVIREAMGHLPRRWQLLVELLMADPPASYAEISDQLGVPVGSIGPTRGRCLDRLRVLLEAS